jgi:predicted RecB family nuclease
MTMKITTDVFESSLHCKYKAFLKLTGHRGMKSDYETLLAATREQVRLVMIDKIVSALADDEVDRNVPLTTAALKRGSPFIFDITFEDDRISILFDGLKRIDGSSQLGHFHYIPILFHGGHRIRPEQKRLLELQAALLSPFQGKTPASALVWQGKECKGATIRLTSGPRGADQILRDFGDPNALGQPPRLILNNHCQICEFRQGCRAQALQQDNISLLRGMGEKEVRRYNRRGIFTVTQLSYTFRVRKPSKRVKHQARPRYFALQAMAIRDKTIYVLGTPDLPVGTTRIYIDIEGDPSRGFVYLLGVTIDHEGKQQSHHFWADDERDEHLVFQSFLDVVRPYDRFTLFYYGSYETAFLKRMRTQSSDIPLVDKLLAHSFNVLSSVYSSIYFPTYSNSLKDIGQYLGSAWTEPDAAGLQSVVWRYRWESTKEEALKHRLITYNSEDVAALKLVTEALYQLIHTGESPADGHPLVRNRHPFTRVEALPAQTSRREYGKATFAIPDFAYVNKAAYFDYQRERVFLRTNKTLRKLHARILRKRTKKPIADERIEMACDHCPFCDSATVTRYTNRPHTKVAYDLRITATGIRRRVIECAALTHRCSQCGKCFLPPEYKKRDKHCHALKSWAMYHHVVHRISFEQLERMIEESFNLRVGSAEFHMIKTLMAQRYRETCRRIAASIVSGKIIHADETQVKLQRGQGYVWVLANLEEVIYLYRPGREGDFLQELLKDFRGVLISDFYAAYDSVACSQQKCLLHLMRDLNHDLLRSPYDDEFKSLVAEFGRLLRTIVSTIDKYGLKKRHLTKHITDVDRFFRLVATQRYHSELAEMYQRRLLKNKDVLFTFLRFDGVPWNNNGAEHAIKHFAYYRVIADGMMTEAGLDDYLVLLSIYQTCSYKGISFLKFLLSREEDVNTFMTSVTRRRAAGSSIDLYPDGFSSNHPKRRVK